VEVVLPSRDRKGAMFISPRQSAIGQVFLSRSLVYLYLLPAVARLQYQEDLRWIVTPFG
jgi:hypothetical protein